MKELDFSLKFMAKFSMEANEQAISEVLRIFEEPWAYLLVVEGILVNKIIWALWSRRLQHYMCLFLY